MKNFILFATFIFSLLSCHSTIKEEQGVSKKITTLEYKNKVIDILTKDFPSLEKYYPETFNNLIVLLNDAHKDGKTNMELRDITRKEIFVLIESRLAHAGDNEIINYMQILQLEFEELQKIDGNACYQSMLSLNDGYVNHRKLLPKSITDLEIIAIGEVLKTSTKDKHIPSEEMMLEIMVPVFDYIDEKYGSEFDLLEEIQTSEIKRKKVCDMTIDLYSVILELDSADALIVLRWMWGTPD